MHQTSTPLNATPNPVVLCIRTDNPTAELHLYGTEGVIDSYTWTAHRELSVTIHQKILDLLANHRYGLHDLSGLVVYEGPGSFTGLRIGTAVANALGAGLNIPVVGTGGSEWQQQGLEDLNLRKNNTFTDPVAPVYGAEAFTTQPKK